MYQLPSDLLIPELKTVKTLNELLDKFPNVGRENMRVILTNMCRKNIVVKIGKTYVLTPAYKKEHDIR